ncbi:MAG: serine/threonine-protein kinase [Chlamydiales bacterium]
MEDDFYKQPTLPGEEARKQIETSVLIPSSIGPFHIESLLETGGMSSIFLATHPVTKESVTIKVLQQKFHGNDEITKRFLNEAYILSKVDHVNIVKFYEQGNWTGGPYIAMEFIEGQSLRHYIQNHPLTLKKALDIILEISYALCHLHTHGVIHRDLKLENVLLTKEGHIKLIDFGIAQILGSERTEAVPPPQPRIIGTPIYMSPEQRENPESVSYPSDIYSMGIIAYELILGKLSHGKVHLALIPKGLQKILSKALQPDPRNRYTDVVDFITAISAYMNSELIEKEKKSSDDIAEMIEKLEKAAASLFPSTTPDWSPLTVAMKKEKQQKLSPMYYDFFRLVDGSYGIAVGEPLSGTEEGVLYASQLRGIVRSLSLTENHTNLIEKLHHILIEDPIKQIFRFSLLTLKAENNTFAFTSCSLGSLWKIDCSQRECQQIMNENVSIGIQTEEKFSTIEGILDQDQILVLSPIHFTLPTMFRKQFEDWIKKTGDAPFLDDFLDAWSLHLKDFSADALKKFPIKFIAIKKS